MTLEAADKIAAKVLAELAPLCDRLEVAGSIRRRRDHVNDVDIVCLTKTYEAVRDRIRRSCRLLTDGPQTIIAELPNKVQLDVWFARPDGRDLFAPQPTNYGTLLLCRTGSKQFNIWFANQARAQGLRWNPHAGMFCGDKLIASATEQEMFASLGLAFIPPEDRER